MCTGSIYSARGKKTIQTLVAKARKAGENTIALVFPGKISFISVSASSWKWKKESLKYGKWKARPVETEIDSVKGLDPSLLGFESEHTGDALLCLENGKLKITEGRKTLLEMECEVVSDEEPRGDDT